MDKVVITGMGTINSLGFTVSETWSAVLRGQSGVARITSFNPADLLVQIACEVKEFKPEQFMPAKEVRRRDRYQQLAYIAAKEAISQSGIDGEGSDKEKTGVVVSSAIGGLQTLIENTQIVFEQGPRKVSPFAIPMLMSNGAAGMMAIDYGFTGPAYSIASACASGSDGIGLAWLMIKSGMVDVMVTGASEATITPVGIAMFDRLGAMSRRNDDILMTPQPFDKNRDGLVMGEGAAILVLESENHAKWRGAEIYAELAGYGATADAFHITAPSEDGGGGARAILNAMMSAGVNIDEVNYINAHGTATVLNDISETKAVKLALKEHAYRTPISSTKSMTGHMMGATGALEVIICVQAIQNSVLPPTINYQEPDPECDLDYVPNQPREKKVNIALSNAFGFGGHNSVLVVRKYH
jgi:3-oxoacyl-[acyl-carrier-protein] synthase II